jgi:hypothetical protein
MATSRSIFDDDPLRVAYQNVMSWESVADMVVDLLTNDDDYHPAYMEAYKGRCMPPKIVSDSLNPGSLKIVS